jgi:type 1 glutamine amidotransferase
MLKPEEMKRLITIIILASLFAIFPSCKKETAYKTLIITGQNNHNWKASSVVLKQILDETGLFSSEIVTTPDKGGDMSSFAPDFSKYRLVVIDYNGDQWSEKTSNDFVKFVSNGGGVVVYHASCMAFPGWKEYNEMIGLGGWMDRNEKDGPYMYYKGNKLIVDTAAGKAGSHGKSREFLVKTRIADHPITKGLPSRWMHGNDELYSQLRGPGKNIEILATAYADTVPGGGTMRDEPMLMTITYGKGRIFSTVMGHAEEGGGPAMQCAGFITTLQRGAEWAVTGNVTQKVPFDFPTAAGVVLRPDFKELTLDEAITNIGSYDIAKSTRNLTCLQSHIRRASGDPQELLKIEKLMNNVLLSKDASVASKKLLLKELSWMGSDYSVPAIKQLAADENLKDEAEYALERLQVAK